MATPTPLGLRLKQARLMTYPANGEAEPKAGWQELSQRELGLLAGMSDGLVGHIERGTTRGVSLPTATKYARVLGINLDWLSTGEGAVHPGSDGLDAELVNAAVRAAREAEAA